MNYFVYIYRDRNGKPRYVGYGKSSDRALSHMARTHNTKLQTLVQDENFKLEIAGPFEDEGTARIVETALISALHPGLEIANISPGETVYRFRPVGVPSQFIKRFEMPPLGRNELLAPLKAYKSTSFLCVLIKNVDFIDEDAKGGIRRGYDPANPLSDEEISNRVTKWWQLRLKLENWSVNPKQSPAILLGICGKPGAQFVIASIRTDRKNWKNATGNGFSQFEVPTLSTPDLDAGKLRGRRISREAGLKFNQGGLIVFS